MLRISMLTFLGVALAAGCKGREPPPKSWLDEEPRIAWNLRGTLVSDASATGGRGLRVEGKLYTQTPVRNIVVELVDFAGRQPQIVDSRVCEPQPTDSPRVFTYTDTLTALPSRKGIYVLRASIGTDRLDEVTVTFE